MHISPQNILFFSLKKRIYEEIVGENDGRKLFMELAQVAASAARIEPRWIIQFAQNALFGWFDIQIFNSHDI